MNENLNPVPVSVVIPTYGREQVLVDTIHSLLDLTVKAAEIIIVDQSKSHDQAVIDQLHLWQQSNDIKLITLSEPSIPRAMNVGLMKASSPLVLFLDDDIKAHARLIEAHQKAQQHNSQHQISQQQKPGQITAGKVIQPWDETKKFIDDGHQFNSNEQKQVKHFMGGNFCIEKVKAVELGGFDENFIGVAYRFEKEFADRWLAAGHKILFEPAAAIDHLKQTSGGTREYGEHLTTIKPHHAVGAYYYVLTSSAISNRFNAIIERFILSVKTRHHLFRPWYIPITLVAELRGLIKALALKKSGPKYIQASTRIS